MLSLGSLLLRKKNLTLIVNLILVTPGHKRLNEIKTILKFSGFFVNLVRNVILPELNIRLNVTDHHLRRIKLQIESCLHFTMNFKIRG